MNPHIIGDIVGYVAKRSKVSETAVRSSITTKCADENKMMRQRMEKERRQRGPKPVETIDNKENSENQQIKETNNKPDNKEVLKEVILKQQNKGTSEGFKK